MKHLQEILSNINEAVERYELLELTDTNDQSEALRKLTSNLFFLEKYRVEYYNKWIDKYYQLSGTNAAKEKKCELEVPELYMIRRIMSSGYKVADSLRSTISIYKKEQ